MITVVPFTVDILSKHKVFYILDKLPKNTTELGVWIKTPNDIDPVDFINVFSLHDGTLLAAWVEPFKHLPLHNVVAQTGDHVQIINMCPLERIIDVYDKPVDSSFGTFSFTKSIPIPGGDWRCHQGMHGPWQWSDDNHDEVFTGLSEMIAYETILSLNGTAHLIYVEATNKDYIANQKINNSIAPASGRTLQETLRLVYEWATMADEPFNSTEDVALSAKRFFTSFDLTADELLTIKNLTPMQVANYIMGSDSARVRPSDIQNMTNEIKNIIFKRVSSMCLSALLTIHGIEDIYNTLESERQGLEDGIKRFKDHYQIPDDWSILEKQKIIDHCNSNYPANVEAFVHNQLRHFANKILILDKVEKNIL